MRTQNRRCYDDEITNPRIEYGGAMTKQVRVGNWLQGRE